MATAFTSLGLVGLVVGVALSSGAPMGGSATSVSGLDRGDAPVPGATAAAAPAAPAATIGDAAAEGGYELQVVRASDGKLYQVLVASDGTYYLATTIPRSAYQGMRSSKPTGEEPTELALGPANQGGTPTGDARDLAAGPVSQPPNPLIAGSLALLGIGLLLFGLRLASGRVR
jgi:hypothetical protein